MKAIRKQRRSRLRDLPPAPAPVLVDPHDEITAVDLPGAVKVAGGGIRSRVLCCKGIGFVTEILADPFVVPCWCPAGKRLQCAVPDSDWPLQAARAAAVAERIGLRRAA